MSSAGNIRKEALALSNKRGIAGAKIANNHLDRNLPIGGVLLRMANKITHERLVITHKRRTGGKPKFDEDTVRKIRNLYENCGKSLQEIASDLGASIHTIRNIAHYVTYSKLV